MQTQKANQTQKITMNKFMSPQKQPFTFSDFIKQRQKFRRLNCSTMRADNQRQRQKKGISLEEKLYGFSGKKIASANNSFYNPSFLNGSQFFDKKEVYLGRTVRKNQRFYTESITPEKIIINRLQDRLFTSQPIQRSKYYSGDKNRDKIRQIPYKQVSQNKIRCQSLSIRLFDRVQFFKNYENPLSLIQNSKQNGFKRQSEEVLRKKSLQKGLDSTDKRQKIRMSKMSKIKKDFSNH